MNKPEAQAPLEAQLGYTFGDRELLARALTHRSCAGAHNERLEHLGDSVLGFIITETLYEKFPQASEGDLTRMRARLVRKEELAARGRELNLHERLRLGGSVAGNALAADSDSLLADAVEAVIGAIYLDGGLPAVKRVVLELFAQPLAGISPRNPKDAKTRLQELLQQRGLPLPEYAVIECAGKPHAPVFTVACAVSGLAEAITAAGDSRRHAEQCAAELALQQLGQPAQSGQAKGDG